MASSMRGGGSEKQTLLLLRHLDRTLFEPHLFLQAKVGDLLDQVPADVRIHSSEASEAGGLYFPGKILRRQVRDLRELVQRESIDVIYDRSFHMTMIAGPAARAAAIPRVSTIVSPPDRMLPDLESRFVALKRRRLAKAYRTAHSVIAVSEQAARSAESYYHLPSGSVQVIRNPVDRDGLMAAVASSEPRRDDRLTFITVGRMTAEKGHRELVRAVQICEHHWPSGAAPLRLIMLGDGPLRRDLESLWQRDRCARHQHEIEFLGVRSNPAPDIAAADCLILPSHYEGMPNVVLEAMALGTPVIATRAGGTVELEDEVPTILWAQPGSPQSLAEAILNFRCDRAAAALRAKSAREFVESRHHCGSATKSIEMLLLDAGADGDPQTGRSMPPPSTAEADF